MASLPADSAVSSVQRRTMIVLIIAQVVGTVGVGVAPSIGVLLAEEVTHNEAWAGLARTASTLGAALFGLWLGTVAARRGRRVALSRGWALAAAGAALLVVAAQLSLIIPLFVGLLFIGAGSAVSLQSRFAATDLAEPQHKARSLALVVWVGTLGSVLGPNLGAPGEFVGSITGLTVFANAFLIAAVFLALAGIVVFAWLRPDPLLVLEQTTGTQATAAGKKPIRFRQMFAEIQANPQARIALIAILTSQTVMAAIMTMTPVHISHQGGSITLIGITISLHVAGMYALSPLVGLVTDRFGYRFAISTGIAIFMASLIIGAVKPHDMTGIIVSLILLGIGWSFGSVAGAALFSAVVAPETRAASQGGVDALSNLSGAIAGFIAGPLLVLTSFSFLSILAMVALVPLAVLMTTNARTLYSEPVPEQAIGSD
ncbi:MAG TPA: MFS transporter [Thermomicrobiales bacterium]|nr:MFS transporter [Thermomicrobiales bacterium]